jgi:hypothetical protein
MKEINPVLVMMLLFFFIGSMNIWVWSPIKYFIPMWEFALGVIVIITLAFMTAKLIVGEFPK